MIWFRMFQDVSMPWSDLSGRNCFQCFSFAINLFLLQTFTSLKPLLITFCVGVVLTLTWTLQTRNPKHSLTSAFSSGFFSWNLKLFMTVQIWFSCSWKWDGHTDGSRTLLVYYIRTATVLAGTEVCDVWRRSRLWAAVTSLPLALLVVPLGREALDWVDPHVQHPLQLLGLPLVIEGPGMWRVDWRKARVETCLNVACSTVLLPLSSDLEEMSYRRLSATRPPGQWNPERWRCHPSQSSIRASSSSFRRKSGRRRGDTLQETREG